MSDFVSSRLPILFSFSLITQFFFYYFPACDLFQLAGGIYLS